MATTFGAVCVEENLLSAVGTAFCDRSCALWAWRVQSHTSHTSMSDCNWAEAVPHCGTTMLGSLQELNPSAIPGEYASRRCDRCKLIPKRSAAATAQ